ncbi:MAG TPA: phosphatidate cytidylyltransferase [Caulobacteraceae bacterium]|nr:phosphatidate cytidylyltransferase [Caulobacteraceae bacterium]
MPASPITVPLPFGLAPLQLAPPLVLGLAGVLVLLGLGALAAAVLPRLRPDKDYTNLRQRVNSWWVMAALLAGALLAGWQTTTLLFAAVSFIGLREFLSLAPMRREDRLVILAAYLAVPANYALIAIDQYGIYLVFIPVYCFMALPFAMACIGQVKGYLRQAATIHWGLVTCVYSLGFGAFLMRTPTTEHLPAGPAGMVFLLLFATEANDVAQYVWGKLIGRHRIMPTVSPNKTWEGFLGGWATTAALIWFLGPTLAPLQGAGRFWMAFGLPLAGFAGDVTLSAVKRDIGVKDTSGLIPGHGGMLDRADSLTFTAPLYFHILAFFSLERF